MKKIFTLMLVVIMIMSASLLSFGCKGKDSNQSNSEHSQLDSSVNPEPDSSVVPEPDSSVDPKPDSSVDPNPDSSVDPEPEKPTIKTGKYNHVIFVGVDGAGDYAKLTDTPNLDKLFGKPGSLVKDGAFSYKARVGHVAKSGENWSSMSFGVAPRIHGRHNQNLPDGVKHMDNMWPEDSPYPSMYKKVFSVRPDAVVGSFVEWKQTFFGCMEKSLHDKVENESYGFPGDRTHRDQTIVDRACNFIKDKKPDFLYLHLGDPDACGEHWVDPENDRPAIWKDQGGFGTDEYLKVIRKEDRHIGELFAAVEEAGIADDTLFITTTDHGGTGRAHGRDENYTTESRVFFGIHGKGVNSCELENVKVRDINAIISYAVGAEIQDYNINGYTSEVPNDMFVNSKELPKYIVTDIYADETLPSKATPDVNSANGLNKRLFSAKMKYATTFDGNTNNIVANSDLKGEASDKLTYLANGIYGQSAYLGKGSNVKTNIKLGTKSCVFSFWTNFNNLITSDVQYHHLEGRPAVILSNKDYEKEAYTEGFCMNTWPSSRTQFNIGNGVRKNRMDITYAPKGLGGPGGTWYNWNVSGHAGDWHHTLVQIDRTTNIIRIYLDFELTAEESLQNVLGNNSMDVPGLSLYIGDDGKGYYNHNVGPFLMDDFIFFDDILTDNEFKDLAAYYGRKL